MCVTREIFCVREIRTLPAFLSHIEPRNRKEEPRLGRILYSGLVLGIIGIGRDKRWNSSGKANDIIDRYIECLNRTFPDVEEL